MEDLIKRVGGLTAAPQADFFPVPDEELRAIEARCGASLPAAYARFLSRYGECSFVEYVMVAGPAGLYPFSHFFGSGTPKKSYSVLAYIDTYTERMPGSVIPFASDGGGNVYCIGVAEKEVGKVYYWDHNREPPHPDEYLEDYGKPMPHEAWFENMTLIAESFLGFLEKLVVAP